MSKNHRIGVTRATIGVITRRSIYDEIAKIHVPALIIVAFNHLERLSTVTLCNSPFTALKSLRPERSHGAVAGRPGVMAHRLPVGDDTTPR